MGECWTEECVEAHTNVDVIVDLQAVRALLDSRLPLVFQGKSVKEASLPWPPSGDDNGDDGEEEEEEEERKVPFGKEGQPVTAAPAKQEAKTAA